MLIRDKLKSFKMTDSENIIIDYFLEQKENLAKKSAREISRQLYCSPSTIVRLCQKLGFSGFDEFKEQFLQEQRYLQLNFAHVDSNYPFDSNDSIQTIAGKINMLYQEIIQDTYSLLQHDSIRQALNVLKQNKSVYIVASSSQIDIAYTFKDKMSRIGKHVSVFHDMDEAYYESCYLQQRAACFILISYTGETQNCIKMAKKLNERCIDFITITSFGTNTLSSLSSCILYVSTRERIRDNLGSYAMTLSTLYLLDVLYSLYFSLDYEKNKTQKIRIAEEFEISGLTVVRDTDNELIK